jgi:hypothetical protein
VRKRINPLLERVMYFGSYRSEQLWRMRRRVHGGTSLQRRQLLHRLHDDGRGSNIDQLQQRMRQ